MKVRSCLHLADHLQASRSHLLTPAPHELVLLLYVAIRYLSFVS